MCDCRQQVPIYWVGQVDHLGDLLYQVAVKHLTLGRSQTLLILALQIQAQEQCRKAQVDKEVHHSVGPRIQSIHHPEKIIQVQRITKPLSRELKVCALMKNRSFPHESTRFIHSCSKLATIRVLYQGVDSP